MPGMLNVFALAPVLGEVSGGGFDPASAVSGALATLTEVFNFFVGNPLALTLLGFTIAGAAFTLFRRFKSAAGAHG